MQQAHSVQVMHYRVIVFLKICPHFLHTTVSPKWEEKTYLNIEISLDHTYNVILCVSLAMWLLWLSGRTAAPLAIYNGKSVVDTKPRGIKVT